MGFLQLKHDKKLGLPKSEILLDIPDSIMEYSKNNCLITFRNHSLIKPDKIIEEVNACTRFINIVDEDIVFYGLESDSPIAPIIFWDIAHTLSIGKSLTIFGDRIDKHYYEREYYKDCFNIIKLDKYNVKYIKIKELPAEKCRGLDDWTFGIPTGPGDATMLNAVVKRILEMKIPKKEIILCGRPGENFKYFDKVKIVGDDIPAPPILISKKKNRIVEEAKYNNLCILHDRVFLPRDFFEIIEIFGDYYSYTTLQSLYFDDKYNLTPRRYSDYDTLYKGNLTGAIKELVPKSNINENLSEFSKELFAELENQSIYIKGNPINYSMSDYPTGTMYIVKKDVWKLCPLNENLKWEEYEDVESGLRANRMGIVTRINPYGFNQSILSRPVVLGFNSGKVGYQTPNRGISYWRRWINKIPIKRKPLFRVTEDVANEKIIEFKEKYCKDNVRIIPHKLTTEERQKIIMELIYKSEFELTSSKINTFIDDCNKYLFLDTIPYSWKRHLYYLFINDYSRAKEELAFSPIIINQLSLRKSKKIFMKNLKEYFYEKSIILNICTYITAFYMYRQNKKKFYNPGKIRGYYKAIKNSTPFIEYIKEELK